MLTTRQVEILRMIVNDFLLTGLPIGSRTLSKKSDINVSAATIRNDMADLEELGYIIQPHISSGRVPSEQGLRFYVDKISKDGFNSIIARDLLSYKMYNHKEIISEAVINLSDITNMTAIITMPKFSKKRVKNLKLIRISDSKVLFVLVTDDEDIKTLTIDSINISQSILDTVSSLILKEFYEASINEMDIKRIHKIKNDFYEYSRFFDYFIPLLKDLLKQFNEEVIFVSGKENLIEDDIDIERVKGVIKFLKDKKSITKILNDGVEKLHVRIGSEIGHELFLNKSIVQSDYKYTNDSRAKIAVIGSVRMDYESTMNIVSEFSKSLSSIFTAIHL